ncbi:MAG: methyltransferase [Saprospiraceae bacterium]
MGKTVNHIPYWQRLWSYLSPVVLDSITSDINENLEVLLVRGHIQLCTQRAVYSYEHKYENFRLLFEKLDFAKFKGEKILLLGLGLGSIIQILDSIKKNLKYTAVELDEEVIYLAETHILKHLHVDLQVICNNAHHYVQVTEEKYDMICMDVFIDDWIPDEFLTLDFCLGLKSILSESGIVIFNTPAFSKKSANTSHRFFTNHFKNAFSGAQLIDVHKNYMLLSHSDLL